VFALLFCANHPAFGAAETTNAPPNRDSQPASPERATGPEIESTAAAPTQGFAEFKIVAERNIFNANRRPGTANRPPSRTERPPRTEAFSVIGTLLYEEGNFAFFAGTESGYNKVLKQGDTIGGCKITGVTQDSVRLLNGENEIDLAMGLQMKRQEEGNWELVVGTASSTSSTSSPSSSSPGGRDRNFGSDNRRERGGFGSDPRRGPGGDSRRDRNFGGDGRRDRSAPAPVTEATTESKPAEATGSAGSADDILQKLMQKREQELNK